MEIWVFPDFVGQDKIPYPVATVITAGYFKNALCLVGLLAIEISGGCECGTPTMGAKVSIK